MTEDLPEFVVQTEALDPAAGDFIVIGDTLQWRWPPPPRSVWSQEAADSLIGQETMVRLDVADDPGAARQRRGEITAATLADDGRLVVTLVLRD